MGILCQFSRYNWLVLVIPGNYVSCSLDPVGVYLMMIIGLGVTVNCPSHVVDLAGLKDGPED